jgi:hypothetical protein
MIKKFVPTKRSRTFADYHVRVRLAVIALNRLANLIDSVDEFDDQDYVPLESWQAHIDRIDRALENLRDLAPLKQELVGEDL